MRKFKIVYENCHHHYHILLLLSPTTHLSIQMEKFQVARGFFFQTSFFTQTRFQFYSVAANMKNSRKGSEKEGGLRLFLSLSSDKSFNWAHIFKIPAFFLRSRKKNPQQQCCHNFFLRFNVKIPAAPKKDLFLKMKTFLLTYSCQGFGGKIR